MSSPRRPSSTRLPAPPHSGVRALSREERLVRLEETVIEIMRRMEFLMRVVTVRVHPTSPLEINTNPVELTLQEAYAQATARPRGQAKDHAHDQTEDPSYGHDTLTSDNGGPDAATDPPSDPERPR